MQSRTPATQKPFTIKAFKGNALGVEKGIFQFLQLLEFTTLAHKLSFTSPLPVV